MRFPYSWVMALFPTLSRPFFLFFSLLRGETEFTSKISYSINILNTFVWHSDSDYSSFSLNGLNIVITAIPTYSIRGNYCIDPSIMFFLFYCLFTKLWLIYHRLARITTGGKTGSLFFCGYILNKSSTMNSRVWGLSIFGRLYKVYIYTCEVRNKL